MNAQLAFLHFHHFSRHDEFGLAALAVLILVGLVAFLIGAGSREEKNGG